MSDIKTTLKAFIVENFLMGDEEFDLKEDDSFLDVGILDSTGVIELVTFLEEEFGVNVQDDEIVPENLDSLVAIENYITSKNVAAA